jgi:hypothetical protein
MSLWRIFMDPIDIAGKWFWLALIAVSFINIAYLKATTRTLVREKPELANGYRTIIRGYLIWGNIPWVIMGAGILIGKVPTIFHYFRPRDGNPFVIAFFVSIFILWILGTYWLIFRGGAKMIATHPGLLNVNIKSPTKIILLWFLCLAGGIAAVIAMFVKDIPVPL